MEMLTVKAVLLSMMVSYAPYNINGVAIDNEQAMCLAMNVYHEAKGETLAGKSAVAHVTLNRVAHKKYPSNTCDVIFEAKTRINWKGNVVPVRDRCQFSWYCDGKADDIQLVYQNGNVIKHNMIAWKQSVQVSLLAMKGMTIDPTSGATHYYNHNIAQPNWGAVYPVKAVLSNHTFNYRTD